MGKSIKDPFTGIITHYDDYGRKFGQSNPGIFGDYTNYDKNGKRIGNSSPGLLGGYTTTSKDGNSYAQTDGCYIATCVYEDYNCPQVWGLR